MGREQGAAGHITSMARRQRVRMSAYAQFDFSSSFSPEPYTGEWRGPQLL